MKTILVINGEAYWPSTFWKKKTTYVVEYNDIPGLSGFSDEAKTALANLAIALLT